MVKTASFEQKALPLASCIRLSWIGRPETGSIPLTSFPGSGKNSIHLPVPCPRPELLNPLREYVYQRHLALDQSAQGSRALPADWSVPFGLALRCATRRTGALASEVLQPCRGVVTGILETRGARIVYSFIQPKFVPANVYGRIVGSCIRCRFLVWINANRFHSAGASLFYGSGD